MSHTPGPWYYRDRMVLGGHEGTYVCEVSGAASNREHQADARLIAAAPDLLKSLEEIIWQMENNLGLCAEEVVFRAMAVAKKARGE